MSVTQPKNSPIPITSGTVFIRPEPTGWRPRLQENRNADDAGRAPDFGGRMELIDRARAYTRRILQMDGPNDNRGTTVIGTGHQATWHHCGIWAKTLVATQFARAVHGVHLHVVVDHDACDTALIAPRWTSKGLWTSQRTEIEIHRRQVPLEMREAPAAKYVEGFCNTVAAHYPAATCKDVWTREVLRATGDRSRVHTTSDLITILHALLNEYFGLANMLYLPVSELSASDAFLRFALAVMADAVCFANVYNEGILACGGPNRRGRRMARPLMVEEELDRAEIPFWLIDRDGRRRSVCVSREGERTFRIAAADRELGEMDSASRDSILRLRKLLESSGHRLRPRAITLTLFMRMALVDWFVHGVGGVGYEQIGDYLFQRYYRRRPPHVAMATCTMTLPQDDPIAHPTDSIGNVQRQMRALEHQPERYIPKPVAEQEPVATLIRRKRVALSHSNDRSLRPGQRKSAWMEIGKINSKLRPYAARAANDLRHRLAQAERHVRSEKARTSREYFFGLFPEQRLRDLIDTMDRQTRFAVSNHGMPPANSTPMNQAPHVAAGGPGEPYDPNDNRRATPR